MIEELLKEILPLWPNILDTSNQELKDNLGTDNF